MDIALWSTATDKIIKFAGDGRRGGRGGRRSRKVQWATKGPRSVKGRLINFLDGKGENDNYGIRVGLHSTTRPREIWIEKERGTARWVHRRNATVIYALGGCKCGAGEPRRSRRGEARRDDATQRGEGVANEESRGCGEGKFRAALSGKGWWFRARERQRGGEMEGDYGPRWLDVSPGWKLWFFI